MTETTTTAAAPETKVETTAAPKAAPKAKAPAAKKPAPKAKATKAEAPKAKAAPSANGSAAGLTGSEIKILTALAAGGVLTRNDLRKVTGIQKGYSGLLGAVTKDGLGVDGSESLIGRKYVRQASHDGRETAYEVTALGRKALENVVQALPVDQPDSQRAVRRQTGCKARKAAK